MEALRRARRRPPEWSGACAARPLLALLSCAHRGCRFREARRGGGDGRHQLVRLGARDDERRLSEPSYNKDKALLSLERRLRNVPPLERIALLNEMIAAVEELSGER